MGLTLTNCSILFCFVDIPQGVCKLQIEHLGRPLPPPPPPHSKAPVQLSRISSRSGYVLEEGSSDGPYMILADYTNEFTPVWDTVKYGVTTASGR